MLGSVSELISKRATLSLAARALCQAAAMPDKQSRYNETRAFKA